MATRRRNRPNQLATPHAARYRRLRYLARKRYTGEALVTALQRLLDRYTKERGRTFARGHSKAVMSLVARGVRDVPVMPVQGRLRALHAVLETCTPNAYWTYEWYNRAARGGKALA